MSLHLGRPVRRPSGTCIDQVAVEEPLEIRVEGEALAVLMRTPGHDEELVAGFLRGEGLIDSAQDLSAVARVAENVIDVRLAAGVEAQQQLQERTRRVLVSSACGICGRASLDQVQLEAPGPVHPTHIDPSELDRLPDLLRSQQPGFRNTGGLHGAALYRQGVLVVVREDVGRHNAADKVLGWDLHHPGTGTALVVSSRAGFEIVQKARMAQVGCVVVLGAATTLSVDLARDSGIELYGFVTPGRYNRYS